MKNKIEFLGCKDICLNKSENSIDDRINLCNELILLYANNGRKFFRYNDDVARFELDDKSKIIYINHYKQNKIKNTNSTNLNEWKGNFSSGGTNQNRIMCLSNYILTAIPFLAREMRLCADGSENDEASTLVKMFGLANNIFTNDERFRYWCHNESKKDEILNDIKDKNLDINKCIIVYPESFDNPKKIPDYIREHNFIHVKSIT